MQENDNTAMKGPFKLWIIGVREKHSDSEPHASVKSEHDTLEAAVAAYDAAPRNWVSYYITAEVEVGGRTWGCTLTGVRR